ncbi:ATP-binding cassette domain-containing protein [Rhodobacteraceae bacterium NNCM2]|nr:ATP-binding cassette domain-containing protein [Coraliihabitans acroporae]
MIEVQNLRKAYGRTVVVDDVSLTLQTGGVTSVIGPNGAGKSTLLSLVARLIERDGGGILLNGRDVVETPADELARQLAFLRQDNHLAVRLTVRDLVSFGRYPYSKGRLKEEDKVEVERAIAVVGLDGLDARFLDELSGGQRQRAFIAMVLAQGTDYALFDEPLNNLDISHAVAVMKLLRQAADTLGKTVVVVLHDLNFASRYSDRIVAMCNGEVVASGAPADVMQPEILARIYGIDIAIAQRNGHIVADYYG